MTPEQYERQIKTFLKNTKEKCENLIHKHALEYAQEDNLTWLAWDADTYTDDFTDFLCEVLKLTRKYEDIG